MVQSRRLFLSTLSLRRATRIRQRDKLQHGNFYPRSPCGERLVAKRTTDTRPPFLSTLSLRRATIGLVFMWWGVRFLSTLSLRRATHRFRRRPVPRNNFYPRSPCGERRFLLVKILVKSHRFLSTLSLRRATGFCDLEPIRNNISIHALLAESDSLMAL